MMCFNDFFYTSIFLCYIVYSGNNVIVDKPIVLNSSCNVGDRSCNVRDRACIRKIGLRFLPCVFVRDRAVFSFCNFFYGMP